MTELLLASDRFFSQPLETIALIVGGGAVAYALLVWLIRRRFRSAVVALLFVVGVVYGYYRVFRYVMGNLGRHLPTVTLLAHATDPPGALGPLGAVRDVEFWLYHPSFREQHAGNHESKVMIGEMAGPTSNDQYSASWTCKSPYTPPRDGDHGGGDGTRTYTLPKDGRPYMIQAHGLDDEWRAKPGKPGFSERITVALACD